jgi:kynureninase
MSDSDIVGYESLASFDNSERFARLMDKRDPLAGFREKFLMPRQGNGEPAVYLAGHLLGLQPSRSREYIGQELSDWGKLGAEGRLHARNPWLSYHDCLTQPIARLIGALPHEVVVMNSQTVNLHLMMASFYRPEKKRFKILVNGGAFPSDQYAVTSQLQVRGLDPSQVVLKVAPRKDDLITPAEEIISVIEKEGESISLVLLDSSNYLSGQAFDIARIVKAAHNKGCLVGANLACGAGNLELRLHDWDIDFAVWCSYRYLNAGPGSIACCFVHDRYAMDSELPRLAGWWGHDRETRFLMGPEFQPSTGAEGWQVSNPPVLQMAVLRASLEIFDSAGMAAIRKKGDLLTGYLEFLLSAGKNDSCRLLTPHNLKERGSQLTFRVGVRAKELVRKLKEQGVICDFREPNIILAAPVPLYNTFADVYRFASLVVEYAGAS